MNAEQAKRIPLTLILETIGFLPVKEKQDSLMYLSPIREERTPSFHVKPSANIWYDHGEGKGGNIIEFACAYLRSRGEDDTISDALRWLGNMSVAPLKINTLKVKPQLQNSWTLLNTKPLENLALIRYLKGRGIDTRFAAKHLIEAYVRNQDNSSKFFALGFKNEDGGYELRNKFLKSCVAPKTITFIRGKLPQPEAIHIFEGFIDYLTFLTIYKGHHDEDVIVLNSVAMVDHAAAYIKGFGYRYANTWMDNDKAGERTTALLSAFCKTQEQLQHKPMNQVYIPHKDVNAWHMHNLNLSL